MKRVVLAVAMIILVTAANAQLIRKIANSAKQKTENKVLQKADEQIDDVLNGKSKKKSNADEPQTDPSSGGGQSPAAMSVYSKFDFIPGEKVIAFEDFSQDAIGDFPARWNTNGSGEVVTADGFAGRWLKLDATGVYMPEFISKLPENFTLEFDLACNPEFPYGASPFHLGIASLDKPQDYTRWMQGSGGRKGFNFITEPGTPSGKAGRVGYEFYNASTSDNGRVESKLFHAATKNKVHVSIWRQKQRVRVYVDEQKLIDLPRALDAGDYNAIVIALSTAVTKPSYYLFSNLRIAAGAPDTRNKLISTGKFVTTGILFDVNSDRIQPVSYPVLKEIAAALKENPEVRIMINGHTDTDGTTAANQLLSEKRAAAVKSALAKEFDIDKARMETSGKGESEPAVPEKTATDKANNRRVEFIKL